MFTIGPKTFHIEEETEQDDELNLDLLDNSTDEEHQHYHVLHTSGKVPAGFLRYLTNSLSKQGHAVVLISEQE